jgi:hypothetical protein
MTMICGANLLEIACRHNASKQPNYGAVFYTNQTLKVVQAPSNPPVTAYPYTIVWQGWLLHRSETYSLERAIAYCDLCIKNIPEFSKPDFIPVNLSRGEKERVEYEILKIIGNLDQEYPDPDDDDE